MLKVAKINPVARSEGMGGGVSSSLSWWRPFEIKTSFKTVRMSREPRYFDENR